MLISFGQFPKPTFKGRGKEASQSSVSTGTDFSSSRGSIESGSSSYSRPSSASSNITRLQLSQEAPDTAAKLEKLEHYGRVLPSTEQVDFHFRQRTLEQQLGLKPGASMSEITQEINYKYAELHKQNRNLPKNIVRGFDA